jgi:dTDP-glucose 4,6-dehydratase/UDP-glucuronate decarboxylase
MQQLLTDKNRRPTSLVTGGAGFLGSHLVDALIARGDSVFVVDNLSTGRIENLGDAINSGMCTFVFGDLTDGMLRLEDILRDGGALPLHRVFHLASPASPEAYEADQWGTLAVNGPTTMALIELALKSKARFIYASTSEIYGDPLEHPQKETYFGNVDPIGPRSCYDEGKRFGEAAVAAAVRTKGLDGRIVRFFNCYGPRMQIGDGRLIPAALEAMSDKLPFPVQGTGLQTRSMTYIEDAVEALLYVTEHPDLTLKPFNIGNDDERTVADILRALAEAAGIPFERADKPARPGDPQRRRPDLTFARSKGWAPTTSLEEGFRKTLEWFRAERHAGV